MTTFTMACLELNVPEGALWGDYFYDTDSSSCRTEEHDAPESDGEWEVVGKTTKVVEQAQEKRPAKWCRDGNACPWVNCKFRHERCSHYDNWLQRGKRGNNCRCCVTDPNSCKPVTEGGCMYDHRDVSKLKVFVELAPCATETELWDSFFVRGLEYHSGYSYNTSQMARLDRALLIRSLTAANVEFEDYGELVNIYME